MLKLHAGVSKKVGLPGFFSAAAATASAHSTAIAASRIGK